MTDVATELSSLQLETARLISVYAPDTRRTVRVVLWANEENGLSGANAYANAHGSDDHIMALEADLGGDRVYGVTFQAAELRSPVHYPIKRDHAYRDFTRSARFEGVPYRQPDPFPIPTQNAARVFWWLADTQGMEAASAWAHAGLRAYFTRGVPLNDAAALKRLAGESGLDADAAERVWNDAPWKERLKRANDAAIAAGVFGAPFFIIDGEPFWGNDRKPQIERWLAQGAF